MIPITKNIIVVDDKGNEYEATYPKRAKGLVKNGRARFIDENKICLMCPPKKYLEDEIMENNDIETKDTKVVEETVSPLTMEYVLSRIDQLINEKDYVNNAFTAIQEMKVNQGNLNGEGDAARGKAISDTVQARETTNQQLIKLLEKMYDDLKPQRETVSTKDKALEIISKMNLENFQPEQIDSFNGVVGMIADHY